MPSQKVRKQKIFVNACRRRLKRILTENGVDDNTDENGVQSFSAMVQEFAETVQSITECRERMLKVQGKSNSEAAGTRHEFNTEVRNAKTILKNMSGSLVNIERKLAKAEKKGQTDTDKYQERKRDVERKRRVIEDLTKELDTLNEAPELKMSAANAGRLEEAEMLIRAGRLANKRQDLMSGAGGQDANGDDEADPETEAMHKQLQKDRELQEKALARILNGVGTLKEKATNIGYEIDKQNTKLDVVTGKADSTKKDLKALNRSTLSAINEASNQSYFTNIACFLLLIALAGVAVYYLDLV
eukprot:TRINITY_DN20959_c0_g1_i1.p1 TRINITY_DN20959_c0_g1~~TRINITY_DN20959_c0_g1_i1.p1  ORF type:complete len:301 (+),score=134.42 TRINITY_DN20959_c0_g1_i1:87-989(+)